MPGTTAVHPCCLCTLIMHLSLLPSSHLSTGKFFDQKIQHHTLIPHPKPFYTRCSQSSLTPFSLQNWMLTSPSSHLPTASHAHAHPSPQTILHQMLPEFPHTFFPAELDAHFPLLSSPNRCSQSSLTPFALQNQMLTSPPLISQQHHMLMLIPHPKPFYTGCSQSLPCALCPAGCLPPPPLISHRCSLSLAILLLGR
ncbi:hypothetical protein EDD17DRAFT_1505130 [Pisolithus thermaeus]|nr:hypothetical protein EDD17DRAFT_1505130 [Pisolithus thermaeus]